MAKRKHPERCTDELPATVREDSEATTTAEALVYQNGDSREGPAKECVVTEGPSGEKPNTTTPIVTTEPVETAAIELEPFWSLLMDVSYTVW